MREAVVAATGMRSELLAQERAPLEPELLERTEQGDLIVEKLAYTTYTGLRVPTYALYPRDRTDRLPAVLACHGHGIGQRAALGLDAAGAVADEPGIHNRFAIELASRGLFVLVPEIIGFGDRRLQADLDADPLASTYSCLPIALQLLLCGTTLAGLRINEAAIALDYLETREEVDHRRIGAFGFSGGGLIASLTAAADARVRAAVLCGYANTYKGSILDRPHCVDNYVPGMLQLAEQPDILGLIAPRPLFIESGLSDTVFPIQSTREAILRLQTIYGEHGAEGLLDYDLFPGGHEISGRRSYDWLASRLWAADVSDLPPQSMSIIP
ncbi:hypothetical protein PA598K_00042 [Paenibacillus sp. 598K]|nr:hypothetical protein PA598K_00042 [Paenibacillus sp. 598K]